MNEIICPDCKKVFKIDEASYAEILKQVHNSEFRNEIKSRLEQANKEKNFEIAKTKNDAEIMEISLIENIQRADLNAIEEANAFAILNSKYGMSHQQIAKSVGKRRATISNSLRLLKLPSDIRKSLRDGQISAGHARAILQGKTIHQMTNIWKKIIKDNLSVRSAEDLLKNQKNSSDIKKKKIRNISPEIRALEDRLVEVFGTKVNLKTSDNGGIIAISYFSDDDLDRLIELIDTIH